ncbi:nucleoside triphosphate pyrophosphohydrolase [Hoeflea prorocentri]|uniref:Nucleoside triphosphate pyrophosphohydrolase n=1 Tax=Hoeflea prorocentri TaxID=1922333 RepID=A0A9X3UGA5_9HYPH|nr:nucleoside triphosphate pyrophosphohydrolase [Hoeflea prorocentri]MCY6380747.1 nucleoside triphosphate pyrophosphohydrolase [Hoeflea prorocentri]MDA5398547.1 nucleoside triphosphate pyrophosphohydrolase [Hoeflea prorocentri]
MEASKDIRRLLDIMAALRDPQTGCPWDVKQSFATIKPYTIEEAYEVADAIERNDLDDLCDELGDLLLQVVFHARMAEELGEFDFGDVVHAITLKMIRRHPHVFANSTEDTPEGVKLQWEEIKALEKAERLERRRARGIEETGRPGLLDGVPHAQPALSEALKLQQKAARVGFDWKEAAPVLDKIEEELSELKDALAEGDRERVRDEFGDLLFAFVNLGRHVDAEPEMALRGTNSKFRKRFSHIETELARRGTEPADATLEEMEELWNEAKRL